MSLEEAGPILNGIPSQLPDIDPDETQEWLDSLDGLVDEAGRNRARYVMLKLLERAREQGARIRCGGRFAEGPSADGSLQLENGFFYLPTVITDLEPGSRLIREETFGPLLTVERFTTEDEAIRLGNDTEYGLSSAVFTEDGTLVATVAQEGMVRLPEGAAARRARVRGAAQRMAMRTVLRRSWRR